MHNLIMLRETRRDSLFAVVTAPLLAIAAFRGGRAFVLALFEHFPQHFVFIVCSSAVHCGSTLAERVDAGSRIAVVVAARWGYCFFGDGRLAGLLAMLLIVHGKVAGVFLAVEGVSMLLQREGVTDGAVVEVWTHPLGLVVTL